MTDSSPIAPGYHDPTGVWHEPSAETRDRLQASLNQPQAASDTRTLVARQGEWPELGHGELQLEDGGVLAIDPAAPIDLPVGYHTFRRDGSSAAQRLIVAPPTCYLPEGLRTWGWAVQLYGARSRDSWGMGDLADLRQLARWSAKQGAGLLQVNPLTAVAPVIPQDSSPYYPTSRCFHNPLYLRIEEVPGAAARLPDLEQYAAAGRALNARSRIDRNAVFRLKFAALELLWEHFPGDAAFDRYRAERGPLLRSFAVYCAIAEQFGADWRSWPEDFQRPDADSIASFSRERSDRIHYHEWLQWLCDVQLQAAAAELPLLNDLPIGFHPGGADAWIWQDSVATGVSVGAPPDPYAASGQNWGLAPFSPPRLAAAGYEPFIQTLRAALRHAGALRIDHVMGLFRLFWIPDGAAASEGGYVRYPADDLLGILALESQRARAVIVGEDLGTVEPIVRERMAQLQMLSFKLLWFQDVPPAEYPELSLASISSHDLPTVAGLWTGADFEELRRLGRTPDAGEQQELENRLRRAAGQPDDAPLDAVIEAVHGALAESPSMILTASLEDALAVPERPNVPGTSVERANWSTALPATIEELEHRPLPAAIAAHLSQRNTGALRSQ